MVKRCSLAGCGSKCDVKAGISIHMFPANSHFRAKWTAFIKLTRPHWKGPTPHSVLCSQHFKPECFVNRGFSTNFRIRWLPRLRDDAIPSIYPKCKTTKIDTHQNRYEQNRPTPTPRSADTKSERLRVLEELGCLSTPVRGHTSKPLLEIDTVTGDTDGESDCHKYTQPLQVVLSSSFRSVGCQTTVTKEAKCQTVSPVRDVGIQCDLLVLPPPWADSSLPPAVLWVMNKSHPSASHRVLIN